MFGKGQYVCIDKQICELVSCFQKAIRRGNGDLARATFLKFWEGGMAIRPLKRALIVAFEDIGLAAPQAAAEARSILVQFQDARDDFKASNAIDKERLSKIKLACLRLVEQLALCPKSRLMDHASWVAEQFRGCAPFESLHAGAVAPVLLDSHPARTEIDQAASAYQARYGAPDGLAHVFRILYAAVHHPGALIDPMRAEKEVLHWIGFGRVHAPASIHPLALAYTDTPTTYWEFAVRKMRGRLNKPEDAVRYRYDITLWHLMERVLRAKSGEGTPNMVFWENAANCYRTLVDTHHSEGLAVWFAVLWMMRGHTEAMQEYYQGEQKRWDAAREAIREAGWELAKTRPLEIPLYAIDKHTMRGARDGLVGKAGMMEFIRVGSLLRNASDRLPDPYKGAIETAIEKSDAWPPANELQQPGGEARVQVFLRIWTNNLKSPVIPGAFVAPPATSAVAPAPAPKVKGEAQEQKMDIRQLFARACPPASISGYAKAAATGSAHEMRQVFMPHAHGGAVVLARKRAAETLQMWKEEDLEVERERAERVEAVEQAKKRVAAAILRGEKPLV